MTGRDGGRSTRIRGPVGSDAYRGRIAQRVPAGPFSHHGKHMEFLTIAAAALLALVAAICLGLLALLWLFDRSLSQQDE